MPNISMQQWLKNGLKKTTDKFSIFAAICTKFKLDRKILEICKKDTG